MSIFENYKLIISKINHLSNKVTLICVTKTFSLDVIKPLVDNGQFEIGFGMLPITIDEMKKDAKRFEKAKQIWKETWNSAFFKRS